jgi:hypothetical protein
MALVISFGVMAIMLTKVLITGRAAFESRCKLQEAWMPLTDAIAFKSAVVPVVGIRGIKPFLIPAAFGLA